MRTSTNYISYSILNNFKDVDVFMNIGGWKHGEIIEFPDSFNLLNSVDDIDDKNNIEINNIIDLFKSKKINFIVTIKNPYMWINSMSNFERKKITPEYVVDKINMWNKHYSNYKNFIENDKAYLFKYETFLKQPTEILDEIKTKFNLTKKGDYTFEKKKLRANNDNTIRTINNSTTNILFDETIYTNLNIYKYLSKDIIKIINNRIDLTLMKFYEYDVIAPE